MPWPRTSRFFIISWRNPTQAQRHWGLDSYVQAVNEAIDVVYGIIDSPNCNLMGACSGGITNVALLGYLAARGECKVNAVTLMVSMFDMGKDTTMLGLCYRRDN